VGGFGQDMEIAFQGFNGNRVGEMTFSLSIFLPPLGMRFYIALVWISSGFLMIVPAVPKRFLSRSIRRSSFGNR